MDSPCQLTRVAIYKRIPRCAANKDNKFLNDASCAIFDTKDIALPTNLIFEVGPKLIGPLLENKKIMVISHETQRNVQETIFMSVKVTVYLRRCPPRKDL